MTDEDNNSVKRKKRIKKRDKKYMNIHLYFTLIVMVDIALITVTFIILSSVLKNVFDVKVSVSPILALTVFSTTIAGAITVLLGSLFLNPFRELSRAMNKVSEGDFSIRLETKSNLREVRETYANFNTMTKTISDIEILQNDFVSNVSHEFKTPIGAIEGYAMLLQESNISEEDRERYVDRIMFNTNRLSDLVGNILLLSKVENQAVNGKQVTFRLDEHIRKAILLLEAKWEEKAVEFDVELDEIKYYGGESILLHVWTNLIGNAIKFGPKNGTIRISLHKEEHNIVFSIEDQGPGIRQEDIPHLFEKFYQGDSSHKEEGNGLGLALVKQIVEFEKGEIRVENMSGGGCRFTVILPEKI